MEICGTGPALSLWYSTGKCQQVYIKRCKIPWPDADHLGLINTQFIGYGLIFWADGFWHIAYRVWIDTVVEV